NFSIIFFHLYRKFS
ncbi:hypothetical protein TNIN_242891, partial [Trichonephila inaurata madagascariensis]